MKKPQIKGIIVSYNYNFVFKLKKQEIKEIKKKFNGQKNRKKNLDKLLKMKPKKYKSISKKQKDETKFSNEIEKFQREAYEGEIE